MIWGNLLHLSYNFWSDREWHTPNLKAQPYLRFDDGIWDLILKKMSQAGMNMVMIDLGDGVRYESHPEIAVKNAWSIKRLKQELVKIRKLGMEPIPKLNFSTCHDIWLGPYSRCVSTPPYYKVCRDLIEETAKIFEKPRFIHIGMDEETERNQSSFLYAVMRQHDLWWNDLYFFVKYV